ncbi:MAG: C10 family peptidase [Prevotella sp.]|nr:C10 family peptidase [Prevotella sp.]
MMKKRSIAVVTTLFATLALTASPIDCDMAKKKAKTFLQEKGRGALQLTPVTIRQSTAEPYHVFNTGMGEGFVIIAGDNHCGDILAYTTKGSFDNSDLPEGLAALLDSYVSEVAAAPAREQATPTASTTRQVITPMVETAWGQGAPYNAMCRTAADKQAVAGYGAVAMAQVLHYHHAWLGATTTIPGYTTSNGDTYESLSATTFDWEHITTHYADHSTETEKTAVAQLMLYAGRAMKTAYGTTSSLSDIAACANALNNYFGFENEARLLSADQCGVGEWENIIYHELLHGRPVVYAANNALNSTHPFIVDGCDSQGFYHINWGQEGKYDGYYRLQAVNLASLSNEKNAPNYGYSLNHRAVVGISPFAVEDDYGTPIGDAPTATADDLVVTSVEQVEGNTLWKVVRLTVENHGTRDYLGTISLQLDGLYLSSENLNAPAGEEGYVDFYCTKEAGTYVLKLVEKSSERIIYQNEAFTLQDTSGNSTAPSLLSYQTLEIDEQTKTMAGTTLNTTVTLNNSSGNAYYGSVSLTLSIIEEGEEVAFILSREKTVTIPVAIPARTVKTFTITSHDLAIGDKFYYTLTTPKKTVRKGDGFNPYTTVEGYRYWTASGRQRAKAWGEEVVIPEAAAAVNFEGLDISSVTIIPNNNPNTLYYLNENQPIPSILAQANVVKGGKATNITFHDGHDFYVPVAFRVAGEVSYSHTTMSACDGKKGWETIVLPFGVQNVTAEGRQLDWFHPGNHKNCDFLLGELASMSKSTVIFNPAEEWRPCTPYIIGVPGNQWGSQYDLTNKEMTFSAQNTMVMKTDECAIVSGKVRFHGVTYADTFSDLTINDEGSAFIVDDEQEVLPFHALLHTGDDDMEEAPLNFASIKGDVNNDGYVNVVDVTMLVNLVLGQDTFVFIHHQADMDGDGLFSIVDITLIVNKILNP